MSERVKLKDICKLINGRAYKQDELLDEGKYPVLRVGNFFSDKNYYYSDLELEENKYCNNGDLLFAWSASFGPKVWKGEKAIYHYHIWKMELSDKIDRDYLYFYLYYLSDRIKNEGHGGIMIHTTKAEMEERELFLPEIEEQKRIVRILMRNSTGIDMRKQQLRKLDDLIKARFVEMFGDVKINPYNYKKFSIKSLLKSCEAGWSGNGTQRIRKDDEIAVLKVSAVTKGYFIPEECKVLDDQENIKKYVTPEKGDLLFSRANTREMVGATAIVKEDYPLLILPDKLWKIKFKDNVNVFYMKYALSSTPVRNQFSEVSTGTSGSMYNVSMDKFKGIEIPVPPIELQNQFADFVRNVDKSKVAVQAALDKAQLLFDSLMQEYFG